MSHGNTALDEKTAAFQQWCFNETVEIERDRKTLEQERKQLEQDKHQLEMEQKDFARRMELEERRLEQQQQLFDMKVKILEEELSKLASDKLKLEKQKEFYSRVNEYESYDSRKETHYDYSGQGNMFFSGVGSKQSLKKRYKDLIKIYHPDNIDGDNAAIQEINNEYLKLRAVYKV